MYEKVPLSTDPIKDFPLGVDKGGRILPRKDYLKNLKSGKFSLTDLTHKNEKYFNWH
jgi:hypothetical protein